MKQVTINYASGEVEIHTDVVRVVGRGYHKITGYRADGSEAFSVLPAGATVSEIDIELGAQFDEQSVEAESSKQ